MEIVHEFEPRKYEVETDEFVTGGRMEEDFLGFGEHGADGWIREGVLGGGGCTLD